METQAYIARPKFNIGYFFLSLGSLVTLIVSVVSFLNLVFETLNKRFPDALNAVYQYGYSSYQYENIRTALSTLIIVFPLFLIINYFWNKSSKMEMGQIDEVARKWMIYIILFLSSLVVMIDLVTLVRYFISGEITIRFTYKILAALVTALLVGFYYLSLLKGKKEGSKTGMYLGMAALLLVIVAITCSFMIIGSPLKQRQLRLDEKRVGDLQNIQYQVINFWQQKEKLPASLEELRNPLSGYSLPVEPEFEKGKTYEYAVKGPMQFELCATFSQPMPKGWQEYGGGGIYPSMPVYKDLAVGSASYPSPGGVNESWQHEAGRTCFSRTIDKDIYPPYPKPLPR